MSRPYSAACLRRVGTVSPANSAARAASYSALSRATISAAGGASKIWPTPWPAPQMSRHALALVLPPEAEVHLALVGLGQRVGIEAGRGDAALQVVAVHAGEEVGVDDLLAGRIR